VVTVQAAPHSGRLRHAAAVALERFLEAGSVPVLVTSEAAVPGIAAQVSSYVRADRVLRVSHTGADLHQVWRRRTPTNAG
jgi:hypothetical protein